MRPKARMLFVASALGVALAAGAGASAAAMTLGSLPIPMGTTLTAEPSTTWDLPTITSTFSPTPTATDEPKEPTTEEIEKLFDGWNEALKSGDAKKVADRYAPDAVLLPTKSNMVRTTRDGIVEYFEEFLKSKPSGKITDAKVKILGPRAAIHTGTYEFTQADGKKIEARFTFVYELVDGKWLIVNHHSSAMPEPKKE